MSATTTLIGNATSDVELRYSQNGKAIGNVTIAVSDRKFDRTKNEYVDGDVWFARCTIWGEMAEHAAGSITKGARVVAVGRIGQRDWEDKEGNKRTTVEVTLEDIGPSLKYATAAVTKTQSGRGSQGSPAAQGGAQASADTPWPATPQAGSSDAWNAPGNVPMDQETPF